jgi:hypothetical protein
LTLSNTLVGDDGVRRLAGLDALSHLYLDGTHLTNAGLIALDSLKACKLIKLNKTGVTADGVAEAEERRPETRFILSDF